MQELLFIDKFKDESLCKGDYSLRTYHLAYKVAEKYMIKHRKDGDIVLDISEVLNDAKKDKNHCFNDNPMITENLLQITINFKDSGIFNLMIAMHLYKTNNAKNYVFTKPLADILMKTSADIPLKYLPKQFSGYFEIPRLKDIDDIPFSGVFINIYEEILQFAGCVKENGYPINYLQLGIDRDKTFREIIEAGDGFIVERRTKETINMGSNYYSFHHVIGNALAFVCNSEFELAEEYNIFASKKSKLERQKKIYTPSGYIVVGKDYHGRKYHVTEGLVSGHWRWQPYGPELSKIKLIYIKPHTRRYKNERD